ncbi:MAG: methyltransferase domain-containing protein, partial [Thermoleophilia bacterium]|nr:methyltransferase domain-containing protein [Thermoleophilia bacterium]
MFHPVRRLTLPPKRLVRRLRLRPEYTVLEVGSGPGYFSVEVARAVPRGKLILLDLQQEMLDMAMKRIEDAGSVGVEYLCGDATSLPLDDASVDIAFMVGVLGEVPDRMTALCEIHRVLRPGGMLSLTERELGNPHSVAVSDLVRMAEDAGFHTPRLQGRWLSRTVSLSA